MSVELVHFIAELKRRRVIRAVVAYGILAFAVLQVVEPIFHGLRLAESTLTYVVLALGLGFPIIVTVAWIFDVKGGRIERTALAGVAMRRGLTGGRLSVVLIAIGLVAAAPGVTWYLRSGRVSGPRTQPTTDPSIAVLPFTNLSADPENAYFADGVQQTILAQLGRVQRLKVISRTSVQQYRDPKRNLREIGEALGARAILEGSVQRAGNRVRVTASLMDARTDGNLWGETYDRTLDDVFAIQSAIAERIAQALAANLTPSERTSIERPPTQTREAWDLYLRAEAARSEDPLRNWQAAERSFRRAIELDPTFALAIAQLSRVVSDAWWFGFETDKARIDESRTLAEKARELQPDLSEAHMALGTYAYHAKRDYAGAEREYRLALRSAPNCAECILSIAALERRQGRWDDALASFRRSLELDPKNEFAIVEHVLTLDSMHKYDEAAAEADHQIRISAHPASAAVGRAWIDYDRGGDTHAVREALARLPPDEATDNPLDRWNLAMIERRFDEAFEALSALRELVPIGGGRLPTAKAQLRGEVLAAAGNKAAARSAFEDARAAYEKLLGTRPDDAPTVMNLATIDASLGRLDRARSEAARASALLPESKDALLGVKLSKRRVEIFIEMGELNAALSEIERLATVNAGFNFGDLQWPVFDRLRAHPRFQRVLAHLRGSSAEARR